MAKQTVEGTVLTTDESRAVLARRLDPVEWLATIAFIWALMVTTLDDFGFIEQDISRTRELNTSYVLIAVALIAAPWRTWGRALRLTVSVIGVSVLMGFLVWQVQEGSAVASNYWPQWLLPLSMLLLGLAYGQRLWWLWRRVVIAYAVVIGAVQLFILPASWQYGGEWAGMEAFYGNRPVGAYLALMMVVALVMTMAEAGLSSRNRNVVASFLGVNVVVAQHRSAWVALLVAMGLLCARYLTARVRPSAWWSVPTVGGFFVFAALLPFAYPTSLLPGGSQEGTFLPDSFESTGTLNWRLDMWESRIERSRSLLEWLVGGVFGGTPVWGPDSDVMNAAITGHSMYVDLLSMLGMVGLAVFLVLSYLSVWKPVNRLDELPIIIWSGLFFGIFYAWPPWMWAILGVALVTPGRSRALTR